jgi:uncharacterized protein YndB with AHSA1/START domain
MTGFVATASTDIDAAPDVVWRVLTSPEEVKKYMFGTTVESDWTPGSSIVWRGEYEGKPYEDKGEVIACEPQRRLEVTHFSPLSGQDDLPENYHRLTYALEPVDVGTRLVLTQDGNGSQDEADHAQANWEQMLAGLKRVAEEPVA